MLSKKLILLGYATASESKTKEREYISKLMAVQKLLQFQNNSTICDIKGCDLLT